MLKGKKKEIVETISDDIVDRKERIQEFFNMAMYDLANDVPMEELQDLLESYKQLEKYEECAGIMRAMDEYSFITYYYNVNDGVDKSDLIQMDFNKDNNNNNNK